MFLMENVEVCFWGYVWKRRNNQFLTSQRVDVVSLAIVVPRAIVLSLPLANMYNKLQHASGINRRTPGRLPVVLYPARCQSGINRRKHGTPSRGHEFIIQAKLTQLLMLGSSKFCVHFCVYSAPLEALWNFCCY